MDENVERIFVSVIVLGKRLALELSMVTVFYFGTIDSITSPQCLKIAESKGLRSESLTKILSKHKEFSFAPKTTWFSLPYVC